MKILNKSLDLEAEAGPVVSIDGSGWSSRMHWRIEVLGKERAILCACAYFARICGLKPVKG